MIPKVNFSSLYYHLSPKEWEVDRIILDIFAVLKMEDMLGERLGLCI